MDISLISCVRYTNVLLEGPIKASIIYDILKIAIVHAWFYCHKYPFYSYANEFAAWIVYQSKVSTDVGKTSNTVTQIYKKSLTVPKR